MDPATHLRKMRQTGDRCHFPVAEMPRQDQDALPLVERGCERHDILHANRGELALLGKPAELEELPGEPPQVRVVRLRKKLELSAWQGLAKDAPQVFEDHSTAKRQAAVQDLPGKRYLDMPRDRERH